MANSGVSNEDLSSEVSKWNDCQGKGLLSHWQRLRNCALSVWFISKKGKLRLCLWSEQGRSHDMMWGNSSLKPIESWEGVRLNFTREAYARMGKNRTRQNMASRQEQMQINSPWVYFRSYLKVAVLRGGNSSWTTLILRCFKDKLCFGEFWVVRGWGWGGVLVWLFNV